MSFLKNFFVEEDGQDMVEYGLVVSLIVAGGITALGFYTGALSTALTSVGTAIKAAL